MNLPKAFKNRIRARVAIKSYTSFHIGGKALYWYEPKDRQELKRFLKTSKLALPIFVIGAGSNLLVGDGLIKKFFIHLKSQDFNRIRVKKTKVYVGAGVRIGRLISVLSSKDIAGYEFLAGIPGTVGGALVMNAGARVDLNTPSSYRELKDIVDEVQVLDAKGRIITFRKTDLKFSYRNSNLKPYIILSARLGLSHADKKEVGCRVREILTNRLARQEWRFPSAGSFFKNPQQGEPAGRLIDLCDLKGFRIGGAQVSKKHANFIINVGQAKSSDVVKLVKLVKEKVYNRFKIELLPEVEFVA